MRTLLSSVAVAALLLAGCVAPEGNDMANSAGTNAVARDPNDADPALWLVKDADTNVYLFGTVHVLKPGQTWFDEGVKAAYDKANEVVIEVITPDAATAQARSLQYARAADGRPLRDKLSPATRAKYEAAMTAQGLPPAAFDAFDPWFAGLTLGLLPLMKAGYDPTAGAEAVITSAAKADGKPVGELETFDQQMGFFENLSEAEQIRYLESTLDELGNGTAQMDEMARLWAAGDPERLGNLMNEAMRATPELSKVLLADRNARWAEWIDSRLDKPGTVFMAVGAGHLAGPDSVQNILARRNLKATRVAY